MSADRLRAAAERLREVAGAETILRAGDPYYDVMHMPDGTPISEMGAFERMMSPPLALALAEWLEVTSEASAPVRRGYQEALRVADLILAMGVDR